MHATYPVAASKVWVPVPVYQTENSDQITNLILCIPYHITDLAQLCKKWPGSNIGTKCIGFVTCLHATRYRWLQCCMTVFAFLWKAVNVDPPKSKPFNELTSNLAYVITSAGRAPMPNLFKIRPAEASRQYGDLSPFCDFSFFALFLEFYTFPHHSHSPDGTSDHRC